MVRACRLLEQAAGPLCCLVSALFSLRLLVLLPVPAHRKVADPVLSSNSFASVRFNSLIKKCRHVLTCLTVLLWRKCLVPPAGILRELFCNLNDSVRTTLLKFFISCVLSFFFFAVGSFRKR